MENGLNRTLLLQLCIDLWCYKLHIIIHVLHPLQVCAYHRSFYRPDNLCLIVAGQVEPKQLLEALQPFEEKILRKVLYSIHLCVL